MISLRRLSTACLVTLAALAVDARAAVVAGPIWNPATGHQYYLLSANTWNGAEAEAVGLGGHLVAILDQAENVWVWETFAPIQGGPLWIGFNDVDVEGTFVWSSGRLTNYTNWWVGGGQPSGDGDAVEMNNYVWNDNDVNAAFAAVAEVVPPGPMRIQVDWSAGVDGAVGPGTLGGSLGTFEVADEGWSSRCPPARRSPRPPMASSVSSRIRNMLSSWTAAASRSASTGSTRSRRRS